MILSLLILWSPIFVYAQLIDNRELPPEQLRRRAPFLPTDRAKISTLDVKDYIILDNADLITIQDFPNSDVIETTMIGNVRIRLDGSVLRAEKLIVTLQGSTVLNVGAYGNVDFMLNGTKYLAESLNYQPDAERGVMYNVRSLLGSSLQSPEDKPMFYQANKVTIESQTRFVLEDVVISTSDVRFNHYGIRVKKLWYLQGKIALALGIEYLTGQASFVWLPAFFQLEGGSGIRSSFGNERRIGYYFINNYRLSTKVGNFDFAFDWYEYQGQYFRTEYTAPEIPFLKNFKFRVDLANDVRLTKNGDPYSQWVLPQNSPADNYQRISQFAWNYEISGTLETNDISLNFNLRDLNDPYFLKKYSLRDHFNGAESIDFFALVSPAQNSWYTYTGDNSPSVDTFTQDVSIKVKNLSIAASWNMLRVSSGTDVNQFLNKFQTYEVRSMTLPSLSYSFGTLDLAEYKYSTKSKLRVVDNRGKSYEIYAYELPAFTKKINATTNISVRQTVSQINKKPVTNFVTNKEPLSISNVSTNDYNWVDMRLTTTAKASYSAQKFFGTNDSSTTTDLNLLNPANNKWQVIDDANRHEESGSINFSTQFFDNLLSLNNAIDMSYRENWSSYVDNKTNNLRDSGFRSSYVVRASLSPKKTWDDDSVKRTSITYNSSASFSYPLYYALRLEDTLTRETSVSYQNSLKFEFLQYERTPIISMDFSANLAQRYRVPTDAQKISNETNPNDIFINDKISDRLSLSASTSLFWFKAGVSTTLDILETETNTSATSLVPITGESFTNKFVGGYPRLELEFKPSAKYHYIPSVAYRLNLFETPRTVIGTNFNGVEEPRTIRANPSYSMEILWDLRFRNYQIPFLYPFIYEVSEFGFVFQYNQDFINLRNSFIRFDFVMALKFTKYITFKFSSQTLNREMYRYFPCVYNGVNNVSPGDKKDFFQDLGDSLTIWDTNALKRSSFKLQSLNFELIHDLDTWDMSLSFRLGRRIDTVAQVAFWEPSISLSFKMKGNNAIDIFPAINRNFVPLEFQ